MKVHPLLERQANLHGLNLDDLPPHVRTLLESVSAAYEESERDRSLLERSIDLSSHELSEANRELVHKNSRLLMLHRVSSILQVHFSRQEALQDVVDELHKATGVPAVAVRTVSAKAPGGDVEVFAGPAAEQWKNYAPDEIFSFDIVEDGETVGQLSAVCRHDPEAGADDAAKLLDTFGSISTLIGTWMSARHAESLIEEQQAQLVHSSKMSALGQMAGGIAHEINNPIAVIQSLAEEIIDVAASPSASLAEFTELAEKIRGTSQRVAKIVAGLRTFSRDGNNDPFEPTDFRKLFEETAFLCLERFKRHDVQFDYRDLPAHLEFECRAVQISQVILNLLQNALDASVPCAERWVRVTALDTGTHVEIRVTDSGKGIPSAHRDRLFQPFFTTKEVGKGTGLGLSISLGIANAHGGSLSLDPNAKNTCFVLSLPKRRATPLRSS